MVRDSLHVNQFWISAITSVYYKKIFDEGCELASLICGLMDEYLE